MIEWLKTLPQDAIVECGKEFTSGYSTHMGFDPVDIESCSVFDYRGDEYKDTYYYGKTVVFIEAE